MPMVTPFSFDGQLARGRYALWSIGLLLSQPALVLAVVLGRGETLRFAYWSALIPYRWLVTQSDGAMLPVLLGLVYITIIAWALVALAFRRAADAAVDPWIATFALAPVLQIPAILFLCVMPSRSAAAVALPAAPDNARPVSGWAVATQGLIAGGGLTIASVILGALVFGTYGYGMFVVSPFIIGAMTAFIGNRRQDRGAARTNNLVLAATALGAIGLVATALEGIVCIVLAAPLVAGLALVGGMFGRWMARYSNGRRSRTAYAFALVPMMFGTENLLPAETDFSTVQTIEIDAPPARVWQALIHMDEITEPLALPFRLGVAYPLRGEIEGEGVGALRRGEFSTGTALERVTAWEPGRKLAFTVLTDVPAMHELSPYQHVHAPHVEGYFRTGETSFELVPLPEGRTEIIERSAHLLRLDPVLYWLPLARWVVAENNARVLAHIRNQAEQRPVAALNLPE